MTVLHASTSTMWPKLRAHTWDTADLGLFIPGDAQGSLAEEESIRQQEDRQGNHLSR